MIWRRKKGFGEVFNLNVSHEIFFSVLFLAEAISGNDKLFYNTPFHDLLSRTLFPTPPWLGIV